MSVVNTDVFATGTPGSNIIQETTLRHPDWDKWYRKWERIRDCIEGTDEVKRSREGMERAWQLFYRELPQKSVPRKTTIHIQMCPVIYSYSGPDRYGKFAGCIKDSNHADLLMTDFIYDSPMDAADDMLDLIKAIRRVPRLPENRSFRYKFNPKDR